MMVFDSAVFDFILSPTITIITTQRSGSLVMLLLGTLRIYMYLYLPCTNIAALMVSDICYSVGFHVACYTHRAVVCSSLTQLV